MPCGDTAPPDPLTLLGLPDDCLALIIGTLTMTNNLTMMVSWLYMDKLLKLVRSIDIRGEVCWPLLRTLYRAAGRGCMVFPNVQYVECSVVCVLPDDPGQVLFPKATTFKARDYRRAGYHVPEFARRVATRTIYPAHLEHLHGDATVLSAVMTHLETRARLHSITWDNIAVSHRFDAGVYEAASLATIQQYLAANSRNITRLRGTGPQRRICMEGLRWDKLECVDVHWARTAPVLRLPALRQIDWWGDRADTLEPWVAAVSRFSTLRTFGISINLRAQWMRAASGMRHLLLQYVPDDALVGAVRAMKRSRVSRWETQLLTRPGLLNPYMVYHIQLRATSSAQARETVLDCLGGMTDATPWVVQMRGRRGWRNPLTWTNMFMWDTDYEYVERSNVLEIIGRTLVYAGVCLIPSADKASKYATARWPAIEALMGAPCKAPRATTCAQVLLDAFLHLLDGYAARPLGQEVADAFGALACESICLWEYHHPVLSRVVGDIVPERFYGSVKRLFVSMVLVPPVREMPREAVIGVIYGMRLCMFGHVLGQLYPDEYTNCFRAITGDLYDARQTNKIDVVARPGYDPRMHSWIMKHGGDDVILQRRV